MPYCRRMVVIAFMLLHCERHALREVCLLVLARCGLAKRIDRIVMHEPLAIPHIHSLHHVYSRPVFTFILPSLSPSSRLKLCALSAEIACWWTGKLKEDDLSRDMMENLDKVR